MPSHAREPLQERSAQSLERVVRAAAKILENNTYEDLTITRIVADSGVSVGSIYARFSNKEGVFNTLVNRFMNDTLGEFQRLDRDAWATASLDEALDLLIETNAKLYVRHRGILRAVFLRTRLANDAQLAATMDSYSTSVAKNLFELLQLHADEIQHPNPTEAILTTIETLTAVLREYFVLATNPPPKSAAIKRVKKLIKIYLQPQNYSS